MTSAVPDDLPLDHVVRPPLPWRTHTLTECGKTAAADALTRDALTAKLRRLGKTRTAMTTCITCLETAQRWPDWDTNPVAALAREVQRVTYWGGEQPQPLRDELLALAELHERHPEEFQAILAGLHDTVRLSDRRARPRIPRARAQ